MSSTVFDEIVAQDKVFVKHYSASNAGGVASLYREDALFMAPNSESLVGPQAVEEAFQGLLDSGVTDITLDTKEVEAMGDTAYEVGHYTMKDASGNNADVGKYIVIWKKTDGQWKFYRDIFNSSVTAQD